MLTIKDNQIFLTRGDSMFIKLSLENEDGTEYTPAPEDIQTVDFSALTEEQVSILREKLGLSKYVN